MRCNGGEGGGGVLGILIDFQREKFTNVNMNVMEEWGSGGGCEGRIDFGFLIFGGWVSLSK